MQALYAQLLVGLINGSFYALLSLGLAVIFGMLNIINFAHGAVYMMGAFCAYFLLNLTGLGYWPALIIAPIVVGASLLAGARFARWYWVVFNLGVAGAIAVDLVRQLAIDIDEEFDA